MTALKPLEHRVVVLPDPVEETAGKSGIIIKAEYTKTQDRRQQIKATVEEVSDCSFADWEGQKPVVGDRVLLSMYAGVWYEEDDVEYKIVNDLDIIGIYPKKE